MLSQIFYNYGLNILRQVFTMVLNFASSVLLARYLGRESFGDYILVIVYAQLTSNIISLGIPTANAFFGAQKEYQTSTLIVNSMMYCCCLLLITPLIYLILYFFEIQYIEYIITITVFLLVNSMLSSVFQGLQDFKKLNSVQGIYITLLVSFQGIMVLCDAHLTMFFNGFLLANIFQIILALYFLRKYLLTAHDFNVLRKQVAFGIKNHLSNIMTMINYRGDMMILEKMLNTLEVGIYNVAVSLVEKIWLLSTTLSSALFPKLSEINKNKREARAVVATLSKVVLLVNIFISIVSIFIIEDFITFFYGADYRNAAAPFIILLPGICLMSISRLFSNYLASINRAMINFYASVFIVVVNISLNIILIPDMGIQGAALASTIAYSLNAVFRFSFFVIYSEITASELLWNQFDKKLLRKVKSYL